MNHHHRTNAHTRPKSGKTNAYQRFALNSPDCVVNDVEHQKNKQFNIIRARPKIVLPTFTCVTFCTAMAGLIIYVGCPHTHTHTPLSTHVSRHSATRQRSAALCACMTYRCIICAIYIISVRLWAGKRGRFWHQSGCSKIAVRFDLFIHPFLSSVSLVLW